MREPEYTEGEFQKLDPISQESDSEEEENELDSSRLENLHW